MRVAWLLLACFLALLTVGYALLGVVSPAWVVACRDSQAAGILDALRSRGVDLVWEGVHEVSPRIDMRCELETKLVVPLPDGLNHTLSSGG